MKARSWAVRVALITGTLAICWAAAVQAQQGSGFKFLEVKVVDPDGKPVTDATVDVTMDNVSFPMPTDDKGMISLNVPSGPNSSLQLKVQKDGFAAVSGSWGAGQEIPTEIEIALKPGIEIGGIVYDEAGKPVEGVTVEAQMPAMLGFAYGGEAGSVMQSSLSGQLGVTDAEGRWRYRGASDDGLGKATAHLHLSHPDYADDNNLHAVTFDQLRAADHVLVLKRGIELRGKVTDAEGNPVTGAKVALGRDLGQKDQAKNTDAEGDYFFGNLPRGETVMTIYSPDFAPDLRIVTARKGMEPVNFQLQKGKPMRIRVTDRDGNPIAGAGVVADTWRGYRTLYQLGQPERTDADGFCVWENAPEDEMSYDFWHNTHMSLRNQLLTAGGEQHEIVLENPLVVNGTVNDFVTGLPIPLFNVVQGMRFNDSNSDVHWERYNVQAGRDGRFEARFTEPRGAHLIRIEAHGYKPATSREIKDGEGEVTLPFKLEHGTGPSGVVKLSDGSPAAGAEVIMASSGGQIYIQNGQNQQQNESVRVKADDQGKYQLPFPDMDYAVVFLHDGGWAQIAGSALESSPNVTLAQWAHLKGVMKVANQPKADEQVNLNYVDQLYGRNGPNVYWNYNVATDNDGNFAFERLKAGEATVGRIISFGVGDMQMSTYSHTVPVQLTAGQTSWAEIGGTGRQIRGKVVTSEEYDGPNPWSMGQVQIWSNANQQTAGTSIDKFFFDFGRAIALSSGWDPVRAAQQQQTVSVPRRSYSTNIDSDGAFVIEDVLPGSYQLHVTVYQPPAGKNYSWNQLGTANGQVTVPEEGAGPVEAGEFKLQLQQQPTGQWQLKTTDTITIEPAVE